MIVTIITVPCRQSVTIYIVLSGTISLLITSLMEKILTAQHTCPSVYTTPAQHLLWWNTRK